MGVLYLGHKFPFDKTNVAVKLPYLRVLLNDAFTIAMPSYFRKYFTLLCTVMGGKKEIRLH